MNGIKEDEDERIKGEKQRKYKTEGTRQSSFCGGIHVPDEDYKMQKSLFGTLEV